VVVLCIAVVMAPVALDAAGCGGNVVVGQGSGGNTSSGSTSSGCLDATVLGSPCPTTLGLTMPCSSPGLCCDYGSCQISPPPSSTCHSPGPFGQHTCVGGHWN
jgi:hypothetical protein